MFCPVLSGEFPIPQKAIFNTYYSGTTDVPILPKSYETGTTTILYNVTRPPDPGFGLCEHFPTYPGTITYTSLGNDLDATLSKWNSYLTTNPTISVSNVRKILASEYLPTHAGSTIIQCFHQPFNSTTVTGCTYGDIKFSFL
jgi:hypothetical protein